MKSIIVQLDEQKITVEKLPLYRYAEVLKALNELPNKIDGLSNMTSDDILKKLPSLIATSLPEVVQILSIATSTPVDTLNNFALDEIVKLALAVYEVNNYQDIIERIKKAASPPTLASKVMTAPTK